MMKELSSGTTMGGDYFDSVPGAMYTLFFGGALLDNIWELMDNVRAESIGCACVLGIVVRLAALTPSLDVLPVVLECPWASASRSGPCWQERDLAERVQHLPMGEAAAEVP